MDSLTKKTKVAEAIGNSPGIILVLERLGLYLGVQEKTIDAICREHNLNPAVLLTLLNMQINRFYEPEEKLRISDITVIVDYLKKSHDYFQSEIYPAITADIRKMAETDAKKEIKMLEEFFNDYCIEVDEHFAYENNVAFPYILKLYQNTSDGETAIPDSHYSVNEYKSHHDDIEEKLDDLKSLLIKFLPHGNSYRLRRNILLHLFELEKDLKAHSKIENEILIPLVEILEQKQNTD
ncbi:MAG: hemerythrin domain-containing protein [Bacteroidales bacterium]